MKEHLRHITGVRDKASLLRRMMIELAGGRISLEGDLAKCAFANDLIVARDEIGALRRNTIKPRQDFIVLRLDPVAVASIWRQIVPSVNSGAIIHIQIEPERTLQFGAYDNFDKLCVVTGPDITLDVLADLKSKKIVRGFEVAD